MTIGIQKTVHLRGMTDSAGSPGTEIATKLLRQMEDGAWELEIDGDPASGFVRFTDNPTAEETVILNGVTWTFKASGATGDETDIKASLTLTLDELVTDLNGSADVDIDDATYSKQGTDRLVIVHDTTGTAGNAYTIASGTSENTISGATLLGGFAGRLDRFHLGGTVLSRLFELVFATDTFGSD